MSESGLVHSTFVVERHFPVSPGALFATFSSAAEKRRWFLEGENKEIEEYTLDFRVDGAEHARYAYTSGTPFNGVPFTNSGRYVAIVPDQRIIVTQAMDIADRRISAALCSFEFAPAGRGTDLIFTHQAVFFEGSDGPERREGGWRTLFERLATAVAT